MQLQQAPDSIWILVADTVAVDGIARGDSIAFTFEAGAEGATIQAIRKVAR